MRQQGSVVVSSDSGGVGEGKRACHAHRKRSALSSRRECPAQDVLVVVPTARCRRESYPSIAAGQTYRGHVEQHAAAGVGHSFRKQVNAIQDHIQQCGRRAGVVNRHRMDVSVRHVDRGRQKSKIVERKTARLVYAVRASSRAVLNRNVVAARVNTGSVIEGVELHRQTVRDTTTRRAIGTAAESDPATVRAQGSERRILNHERDAVSGTEPRIGASAQLKRKGGGKSAGNRLRDIEPCRPVLVRCRRREL